MSKCHVFFQNFEICVLQCKHKGDSVCRENIVNIGSSSRGGYGVLSTYCGISSPLIAVGGDTNTTLVSSSGECCPQGRHHGVVGQHGQGGGEDGHDGRLHHHHEDQVCVSVV